MQNKYNHSRTIIQLKPNISVMLKKNILDIVICLSAVAACIFSAHSTYISSKILQETQRQNKLENSPIFVIPAMKLSGKIYSKNEFKLALFTGFDNENYFSVNNVGNSHAKNVSIDVSIGDEALNNINSILKNSNKNVTIEQKIYLYTLNGKHKTHSYEKKIISIYKENKNSSTFINETIISPYIEEFSYYPTEAQTIPKDGYEKINIPKNLNVFINAVANLQYHCKEKFKLQDIQNTPIQIIITHIDLAGKTRKIIFESFLATINIDLNKMTYEAIMKTYLQEYDDEIPPSTSAT